MHSQYSWTAAVEHALQGKDEDELHQRTSSFLPAEHRVLDELVSRLRRSERRERLLRSLTQTATDIATLRDTGAVLKSLSERTRRLLNSDMAYVSLNDPETGETFIEEGDGINTSAYRNIRMPLGTGVLGKVATGLAPVSTINYLEDQSILHIADVDETVREEGVRSIVGVPLSVHGRVLGALLVAQRYERVFQVEELEALSTLARHAAVALDNSLQHRALIETLRDLGESEKATSLDLQRATDRIELDEQLTEMLARRSTLEEMLILAHTTIGSSIAVLDQSHRPICSTLPGKPIGSVRGECPWLMIDDELISTVTESVATGSARKTNSEHAVTVLAMTAGAQHNGSIVVDGALGASAERALARFALFISIHQVISHAQSDVQRRAEEVLIRQAIHDDLSLADIRSDLARHGVVAEQGLWVHVVDDSSALAKMTVRRALRNDPSLVGDLDGAIVVLSNSRTCAQGIDTALSDVDVNVAIGTSRVTSLEIQAAHRRAQMACKAQRALGRSGVLDAVGLVGVLAVVESLSKSGSLDTVLESISGLVDHDAKNSTELTHTAWVYLENSSSVAQTARALYLHRNSVTQRLGQIAKILGERWSAPMSRLDLHVALWAWKLRETSNESHRGTDKIAP